MRIVIDFGIGVGIGVGSAGDEGQIIKTQTLSGHQLDTTYIYTQLVPLRQLISVSYAMCAWVEV